MQIASLCGNIALLIAHLQVCQAALARAAYILAHGWPQSQIRDRMNGIVNGVDDERDGCAPHRQSA